MANTYTQVFLHIIFAVKNTASLMPPHVQPRIHALIASVIRQYGHYPYAIGGIDSHIHILIGYNLSQPVPELVRLIKNGVSRLMNDERITPYRFEWQKGYGCFSYSRSQVDSVCRYIARQYEHHKSVSLEDEIKAIMDRFEIEYDCKYILRDPRHLGD